MAKSKNLPVVKHDQAHANSAVADQGAVAAANAEPAQAAEASAAQDSDALDAGHADSQSNDMPATSDAASGGENPAGEVLLQSDKEPPGGWCYPVLTPFKFRGSIIKEGHIQLTAEEAEDYLTAEVIGNDVCFPPDVEAAE